MSKLPQDVETKDCQQMELMNDSQGTTDQSTLVVAHSKSPPILTTQTQGVVGPTVNNSKLHQTALDVSSGVLNANLPSSEPDQSISVPDCSKVKDLSEIGEAARESSSVRLTNMSAVEKLQQHLKRVHRYI